MAAIGRCGTEAAMQYLIDDELCRDLETTLQVIARRGSPDPEVAPQLLHRLLAAVRASTRRFAQLQSEIANLQHEIASLRRDSRPSPG
jgi:hypothetical protein